MRFKSFYLLEKVYDKTINELKSVLSGIVDKEIPNEVKVDKGVMITIPSVGAWGNVKKKFSEAMLNKKYKDYSKDANSINFKNNEYSIFVDYVNSTMTIFVTDDLKFDPNEENENEV